MITALAPEEIFVFGSNERGAHGAGAALQAAKQFGCEHGLGEGLSKNQKCYAFPTLDSNFQKRSFGEIEKSRDALYVCCAAHPEKRFLLTKVGCGLASFSEQYMRSVFSAPPANLILPEDWRIA